MDELGMILMSDKVHGYFSPAEQKPPQEVVTVSYEAYCKMHECLRRIESGKTPDSFAFDMITMR